MVSESKSDSKTEGAELAECCRALVDPIEETTATMATLTDRMAKLNDCMDDFAATREQLASAHGGDGRTSASVAAD